MLLVVIDEVNWVVVVIDVVNCVVVVVNHVVGNDCGSD